MYYFKYKNKVYIVPNLEKKLKRMKLSLEDIEVIDKPIETSKEDDNEKVITKHHFVLPNGYTVTSIYDNLDNLGIKEYKQID